jgi:hypothetical protein
MTRMSKQGKRRHQSPRKRHYNLSEKTGPRQDNLEKGYREHPNALAGEHAELAYIPKIR